MPQNRTSLIALTFAFGLLSGCAAEPAHVAEPPPPPDRTVAVESSTTEPLGPQDREKPVADRESAGEYPEVAPPSAAEPTSRGYGSRDDGNASPAPARKSAGAEAKPRSDAASLRPGLGTEWGETRASHIDTVTFTRGDWDRPIATAKLFYNDEDGASALTASGYARNVASGQFPVAHGTLTVGLRADSGGFFRALASESRDVVVGEAGRRYRIVMKNRASQRFECVVSVDGLDVLDGKSAAFHKRGYLIDPRGELEIDGFRQSYDTVASFRFGSVESSYANQKYGDARNVGVIGIAVFRERGASATPWNDEDARVRVEADPFPGRFASPPR